MTINNKNVSGKLWGEVDKNALQNRLYTARITGEPRAEDAIRECYAVIRGATIEDAPSENWLMPHHELNRNNVLVLNRGGMIAAAGILARAGLELNLTTAQMREASQHLLRHYRQEEVNLEPPQILIDRVGEMCHFEAKITGEMRPTDIPLAPGINVLMLKEGDPDPMEVVVEIPSGTSTRGWEYGRVVIRHLAEQLMQKPVAGFLGHQKSENLESEFPTPVTHWVGAIYKDGKTYVRGVIDKAAGDLKRWIRANVINQVSIFGHMATEVRDGKTHVTSVELLSIDWVPLDRAGMNTRVVAVGEMNKTKEGEEQMTLAELMGELRRFGVKPGQILGEMGWDFKTLAKDQGWEFDKLAGEIGTEKWTQAQAAVTLVGELMQLFNVEKREDLLTRVKESQDVQRQFEIAKQEQLVDKVLGEMVPTEVVRPWVKKMLRIDSTADEATIKKVVGELMQAEDTKALFAGAFKDVVIAPKVDGRQSQGTTTLVTKRVSI